MDIKGVVKRGEYTYRFTVSCGFDGSGKHTRKTMTYKVPAGTAQGKAEKMVMQAYLDFESKCKGTPRYSSNMRFKELAKIYLDEYGTYKLKPVTKYNYERDLELHILPVFGNKRVNSITTADLTNFFTTMNKASETTRKLRTVMSSVFSYGKSQGYVKENPCSEALYKTQVKQPQKVKYLDKEKCQKLMALNQRPHREFCVSDFRQNQEYHVFNVQDGGLFPLVTPVPEGWDGMRAVCGVNAGAACRESCFKGISPPCGRRT